MLLGGAAAGWPRSTNSHQEGRIARVGARSLARSSDMRAAFPYFPAELRKFGFVERRNLLTEFRRTDQSMPQAVADAKELVASKPDVVFVWGGSFSKRSIAVKRN
jgi:hypothetical protein